VLILKHTKPEIYTLVSEEIGTSQLPTLQEIDASVSLKKNLTFPEIMEILDAPDEDYAINPAHCSKPAGGLESFPSNTNFDQFITLFDEVDWKKNSVILKKLKDEEQFITFLMEQFPSTEKEDFIENFDFHINNLAKKVNLSKEQYAESWCRQQLTTFVAVLKGEKALKGTQKDLADTIYFSSKVLAHLESIQKSDSVSFEDDLLKIATEGGDYCARQLKNASSELTSNILRKGLPGNEANLQKNHELKIGMALQEQRKLIVDSLYKTVVDQASVPNVISSDIHTFDIYRLCLSLGFLPLTDHERANVGIIELLMWESYGMAQTMLYHEYRKNLCASIQTDSANSGVYIDQVIAENTELTDAQKDAIAERWMPTDNQSVAEVNQSFWRLMLVMMGVLRKI